MLLLRDIAPVISEITLMRINWVTNGNSEHQCHVFGTLLLIYEHCPISSFQCVF